MKTVWMQKMLWQGVVFIQAVELARVNESILAGSVGSAPGGRAAWPGWKHLSPCGKLLVGMNEYCQ